MDTIIEKPRNGCALHGALQTAEEIGGVVPIIHANGGCSLQNYYANKSSGFGNGYISGYNAPSTNFQERHIIFGGASRLREQIKNTLKVFKGELYVVLNSCESAMVGDDIEAMTKEVQEQGEPVIENLTAGFHGDIHVGYETFLINVFSKIRIVKKIEKNMDSRLVNILGIIPNQDLFYKGELEEVVRILEGIGVKSNTFLNKNGVREVASVQNASINIVFSKWGLNPAEKLKELYGIDYIFYETIPTGVEEVEEFLQLISEKLQIDHEVVERFVKKEKEIFNDYFERIIDIFYEGILSKEISIVGDERIVRQIAILLKKYFGVKISTIVITDYRNNEEGNRRKGIETLNELATNVKFSQDGKEIHNILIHSNSELILGSSLEREAAFKLGVPLWEISYPTYGETILSKSYSGVKGVITFAEDYIRIAKKIIRDKKKIILQEIGA